MRTYDPEILGWRHVRLQEGKEAARDPDERAMIYDTTLPGYGNEGQLFGDAERDAVLEYLKTL